MKIITALLVFIFWAGIWVALESKNSWYITISMIPFAVATVILAYKAYSNRLMKKERQSSTW